MRHPASRLPIDRCFSGDGGGDSNSAENFHRTCRTYMYPLGIGRLIHNLEIRCEKHNILHFGNEEHQ